MIRNERRKHNEPHGDQIFIAKKDKLFLNQI